ncbi:MAG: hypothetical protein LAP86_16845 [Acidobacteriia bacterium]|nr:hypothetical protein [Terriglobia bacterium]
MFTSEISDQLKYYVYRLIDPRNGETFYVGKGTGNRVFAHVKGELGSEADTLTDKLQRIRDIRVDGFEVAHVIHRHGLDQETSFEVEAALIDAYPEATNAVGGRASDERGLMHANQIIERYKAQEAVFKHKAILINVNRSAAEKDSVYEAVRYAWKLDPKKAAKAEIVLAVLQGLIIGVYVADQWLAATPTNFPHTPAERPGRWGFVGREAPEDIARLYLRRRLPDSMRKRGAANPVKYAF